MTPFRRDAIDDFLTNPVFRNRRVIINGLRLLLVEDDLSLAGLWVELFEDIGATVLPG